MHPSPPPYDLHAQSHYEDQFRDVYDHHSYPYVVCFYYQSFDHDVNYYPYYSVSNETCAILNAMIETMNEQQAQFVSKMRECGLLHGIDLSLPIHRLV